MEGGDGESKGGLGVVDFGAGGLEEIVHEGGYTVEYPSSWSGLSLDLIILALDLGICRRFSGGRVTLLLSSTDFTLGALGSTSEYAKSRYAMSFASGICDMCFCFPGLLNPSS